VDRGAAPADALLVQPGSTDTEANPADGPMAAISHNHSTTQIDGLDIAFLHIRSPHADATPLLMTHDWPGSVLEFRHVIAH
jgi:hypothetical protein